MLSNKAKIPLQIAAIFFLCLFSYSGSLSNGFMLDDYKFVSGEIGHQFPTFLSYFTNTVNQHYTPLYPLINVALFKYFAGTPSVLHCISILLFFYQWGAAVLIAE